MAAAKPLHVKISALPGPSSATKELVMNTFLKILDEIKSTHILTTAVELRKSAEDCLKTGLPCQLLTEKVQEKSSDSDISSNDFTSTIMGGSLIVAGFGLGFVTFGATLGLTIAGGALFAAAGGATATMHDVVQVESKSSQNIERIMGKQVDDTIKDYREQSIVVRDLAKDLSKQVSGLNVQFPSVSKPTILFIIFYKSTYKSNPSVDIVCSAEALLKVKCAWKSLKELANFDDVEKNPHGPFAVDGSVWKGSHMQKEEKLTQALTQLEEHKSHLMQFLNLFEFI